VGPSTPPTPYTPHTQDTSLRPHSTHKPSRSDSSRRSDSPAQSVVFNLAQVQSMSTIALGAGAVPAAKVGAVRKALVADIVETRGTHLTVGATGQKWLLRMLSEGGAAEHDVALALAAQDTFPGWGWWVAQGELLLTSDPTCITSGWINLRACKHGIDIQYIHGAWSGATTCWESWTGLGGPAHPGVPGRPINPPTHNHIFLCGGVGEWMYRSLGGISPASPGYAAVKIAPQISKTLDPASANATVSTVRGVVEVAWTRHSIGDELASCTNGRSPLVTMTVSVPVGMLGEVHIPLLGRDPAALIVEETRVGGTLRVWAGAVDATVSAVWLQKLPRVEGGALVFETGAAELDLATFEWC
jgi:hypothetical protein